MRYHCGMKYSIMKTLKTVLRRCAATVRRYWLALAFIVVVFMLFFVRYYDIGGKFSLEIGNPKDSFVTESSADFLKRNVPGFKVPGYAQQGEKIGWITDIHADRFKRRTVESGTIYPREYEVYIPKIFDALRAQGIDTVVTTGDNVNSGDSNYSRALEKMAEEKHMHVIWTIGNHDRYTSMADFGITGKMYYYTDYGNTRIVSIDDVDYNRQAWDYEGGIDDEQMVWLRHVLETDKRVIIAMHIPIFPLSLDPTVVDRYAAFEKLIHDSGNVKIVLSGHFYIPWQKEFDGLHFFGEAAVSHDGYKGAYGVIDLKDYTVSYQYAK